MEKYSRFVYYDLLAYRVARGAMDETRGHSRGEEKWGDGEAGEVARDTSCAPPRDVQGPQIFVGRKQRAYTACTPPMGGYETTRTSCR